MRPPHKDRAPSLGQGPVEDDLLTGPISSDTIIATLSVQRGRGYLIDRFGHRHSEAILDNWSAAALIAMRVRRKREGGAP